MARTILFLVALLGVPLIGVTLWAWGQPLICTCGTVRLWVPSIFSSENSQHIADWYTLSHILHGMLIPLLGRVVFPRLGFNVLFAIAIVTGIGWEIIEHTDWVLNAFRATTINRGYLGDSVLNAVMDYVFMMAGFFAALALPIWLVVAAMLALELIAGLIGRDNLTLSTIQLIAPIDAIDNWQQELNPDRGKPLTHLGADEPLLFLPA
ncbi:DUF2585 family protein [Thalassorhabdomicrobium marinisediminis]|uniref:DUF2585 domain-containing protein n=1 Tax=Thalassorhabdomicrobium marinisediminis TaxID=2170577 RepID=A0A2T7FVP2_9RHOB|nr:DUF2585 family protein [Thalassorhabdomicrobium marinisediminis]PVA06222.1 hypothetical protein DC363_09925 [Thalassorhabdomicrobium marinisediminis]